MMRPTARKQISKRAAKHIRAGVKRAQAIYPMIKDYPFAMKAVVAIELLMIRNDTEKYAFEAYIEKRE